MIVYADRARIVEPRALLAAIAEPLPAEPLARHAAIAGKLALASELAQGLGDAAFDGADRRTPCGDAALALCCTLARALARSWDGADPGPLAVALDPRDVPRELRCKRAEGYAYYAVYPELYREAARRALADDPSPRRVIGIRSIGAGLAAIVAEATGAPLPATVRPFGDPFRREVAASDALIAEWLAPGAVVAIVDEGPGISGSSFGAVADLVEDRGATRLELYPSHAGELGARAAARHRERWRRAPRRIAAFEDVVLPRLASWIASLAGPLVAPLVDLSAGAWRRRRFADERTWPPCVVHQERRKYLARTAGGTVVARFAGIGEPGERTLAIARRLHAAGFTPEPLGLCHGFLIERWHDRVLPLASLDRRAMIDRIGAYLEFRAHALAGGDGAEPAALAAMARHNAALALDLPSSPPRRIAIDGRMHAWEWLVLPGGTLLKADAYDHHAGHDLIGCQDVAWDVAGAAIELALDTREAERLAAIAGARRDQLDFARGSYLAFQIGRHALAIDFAPPDDQVRLRDQIERYRALLR